MPCGRGSATVRWRAYVEELYWLARGLIEPGLVRPLALRQLLTVMPTESELIEWVREAARVSAAAPVTEATQLAHTVD